MKITDIVKSRPVTISCELFPPKKDSDFAGVAEAAEKIATLRPDFISITYGAGGGTRKNTVEIASMVQDQFHVTSIAHLTCFSSTPEEVDSLVTDKVEAALSAISDVKTMTSRSGEGSSMTMLEFDYSVDMDEKYDEINEALQRVRLPDSAAS